MMRKTILRCRPASVFVSIVAISVALTGCSPEAPKTGGESEAAVAPTPAPTPAATPPAKTMVSPLAGTWYSADRQTLHNEIAGYFDNVAANELPNVQALILPHAGYRYSAATAAYGVKLVMGRKFSRVVILGPSHRVNLTNAASLPAYDRLETPLGAISVDKAFVTALKSNPMFKTVSSVDEVEHSVQIQAPLLQQALGEFAVVPIVVGSLNRETVSAMAKTLLALVDEQTLVVASSDFTHYGPNYDYAPFKDNVAENLKQLDMAAFDTIRKKSVDAFDDHIQKTGDTICGRYPIGILLTMLPKDSEPHLMRYETSGQNTGDFTNSVSYLSIAFTGAWPASPRAESSSAGPALSQEDKSRLLKLARKTLERYLIDHNAPDLASLGIDITPAMNSVMGGFVTLKEDGELRGCIGEIEPRRPLSRVVMDHAIDAAIRDPRFPPVTVDELARLQIEISALTPPRSVASYREIVIGKHGVTLEKGFNRAVFLPQVAPEQGWNIEQTLGHLAVKAGLSEEAWKEGASFQVFEAVVFGEDST